MLPDDWASSNSRDELIPVDSPEYAALLERFEALGPSDPFNAILNIASAQNQATHVFWERQYIDADYRDEFANFYASTYPPHPDRCERLHFLRIAEPAGESESSTRNLGYIVVRPISRRPVSRTMIRPPEELEDFVSCQAQSSTFPLGVRFSVPGFPFLGQDTQYGVCAHAVVWMICHYHHLRFRQARRYMSDIVKSAGAVQTENRLVPSQGLTAAQIARAFQELKLPAVHYDLRHPPPGQDHETIACRYLNSGLPVLLATKHSTNGGHATVLVGYRTTESNELEFIRHNDATAPYECVLESDDPCGSWQALMVPLPGKLYMSGETAEEIGSTFLAKAAEENDIAKMLDLKAADKLDFRSYAIQARLYKQHLGDRGVHQDVRPLFSRRGTSQWVWVVEAQDRDAAKLGRECVLGEIVLDATSSDFDAPLCMYVPGAVVTWPDLSGQTSTFRTTQSDSDYVRSGTAIHVR